MSFITQKYLGVLFPTRHTEPLHVLVPPNLRVTYRRAFVLVNLAESEVTASLKP